MALRVQQAPSPRGRGLREGGAHPESPYGLPPHPAPLPQGEREKESPLPLREGVGGGVFRSEARAAPSPDAWDTTLLRHARAMRRNPTPAEAALWRAFRRKSFAGLKIRRQVPYGRYILDFYVPADRLAIEVDGDSHAESAADARRDAWLAAQGVRTLRFWNNEVTENIEGVLLRILAEIGAAHPPHPGPLPQGEREKKAPSPRGRGVRP